MKEGPLQKHIYARLSIFIFTHQLERVRGAGGELKRAKAEILPVCHIISTVGFEPIHDEPHSVQEYASSIWVRQVGRRYLTHGPRPFHQLRLVRVKSEAANIHHIHILEAAVQIVRLQMLTRIYKLSRISLANAVLKCGAVCAVPFGAATLL